MDPYDKFFSVLRAINMVCSFTVLLCSCKLTVELEVFALDLPSNHIHKRHLQDDVEIGDDDEIDDDDI